MIHYQLRCDTEHEFDGWFRDAASFEAQAKGGFVTCPQCGATEVRRALMTPSVRRGRAKAAPVIDQAGQPAAPPPVDASATKSPSAEPPKSGAMLPDGVRAMLQKLRAEVEQRCEHVGNRFAEEARAIHRGESEVRGIYGDTTPEQAEALAEEGVQIARIPWVPRADG